MNLLDKGFAVILESITKLSNQISKYVRLTCLHQGDFSNEDAQVTELTSGLDTSHLQITRKPHNISTLSHSSPSTAAVQEELGGWGGEGTGLELPLERTQANQRIPRKGIECEPKRNGY